MKKVPAIFFAALLFLIAFSANASAAYTVQRGDTVWGISQKYSMGYADILRLNPQLANPDLINVGQKIVVRTGNKAADIIDYASALQSVTKYQYGGQNAPYLTDCSGWTQHIYSQFGIALPRVSKDQAHVGTPITFKNMRPGDLMFFSTRADKVISHVGIYIGNNQWISNLSTKQNVTILSTHGSWTQQYFLWAQRVI